MPPDADLQLLAFPSMLAPVPPAVPRLRSRLSRLAYLGLLYFVQGLPLGIQIGILPIVLREHGASRSVIAYTSALALPWMLKVFYAPVLERTWRAKIAIRRRWILSMQALAALVLVALAALLSGGSFALVPLMIGVFVLNLAMATMDVAVDGLAVDVLSDDELGPGNAAQVGGYKLGMLFAGGAALQLLRWFAWPAVFLAMAGAVAAAFVATRLVAAPARLGTNVADEPSRASLMPLLRSLARDASMRWLVVLLLAYKAGEAMADAQFRPFLVDAGLSAEDIGLLAGVYGALASTVGSFVGGAIAARQRSLVKALFVVAAFRVLPLIGQAWIVVAGPTEFALVVVSLAEHLGGGMLTTVVFALMMSSTDRAQPATSFTLLAAIENVGKGLTGFVSGLVADHLGDRVVFGTAALLSALFLALYLPMRRHERAGAYRRDRVVS